MPDATAMAVSDGPDAVVRWLGSDTVVGRSFLDAEVIDLDGAFVAPALVNSHVHVTATGLSVDGLDLRGATSLDHLLRMVAEHAGRHPDGPIWGHGWDETTWPRPVPPTTADLDALLGDRPVYLARVDVHSAVASTALRRLTADLEAEPGWAARSR